MKKLLLGALLIALTILPLAALADPIDISGLSQDELHALIDSARLALVAHDFAADEDMVLLDHPDAKVTMTGIELYDSTLRANQIVENRSDKELVIRIENCYVNGWLVSGLGRTELSAGKKAKDNYSFFRVEDADVAMLEDVADLEFTIIVQEIGSSEIIVKSDPIRIDFKTK